MNAASGKRLNPALFGKILLARFLDLSLKRFDAYVKALDADPGLERLSRLLVVGQMKWTKVIRSPAGNLPVVGEILSTNETFPLFLYYWTSCTREYRFDDSAMGEFLQDGSGNEDLRRIVRRLRLVNTRNRMGHGLMDYLLRHQSDYLLCGDPVCLRPLTQTQLSNRLSSESQFGDNFDVSRLSRISRNFPLLFPDRQIRRLSYLCPNSRDVSCHFVRRVIESEKSLMAEGEIDAPLSDNEVAQRVEEAFGTRISRRTVAHIRREMGIPEKVERAKSGTYQEITADFSPPYLLSRQIVREFAPSEPGVYEIRSFLPGFPEEVLYIGSAGNIRKRLSYHLYSSGGNQLLRKKISAGSRFRYQIFKEAWRTAERSIYRSFRDTFGKPPECNRASP